MSKTTNNYLAPFVWLDNLSTKTETSDLHVLSQCRSFFSIILKKKTPFEIKNVPPVVGALEELTI